jgi:hypothetical protein
MDRKQETQGCMDGKSFRVEIWENIPDNGWTSALSIWMPAEEKAGICFYISETGPDFGESEVLKFASFSQTDKWDAGDLKRFSVKNKNSCCDTRKALNLDNKTISKLHQIQDFERLKLARICLPLLSQVQERDPRSPRFREGAEFKGIFAHCFGLGRTHLEIWEVWNTRDKKQALTFYRATKLNTSEVSDYYTRQAIDDRNSKLSTIRYLITGLAYNSKVQDVLNL